jgi:phosphotransferase family enzyme
MNDPLRHRPPERTLRWVTESVGAGSRISSVRRLTEGGRHANHSLTVIDRRGSAHRLVLRRWARPERIVEDPDFTAEREATVLELLSDSPVPAPRLVAADPDGAVCDVPALLITRLPGRPPTLPRNMDSFLAQVLSAIHAVSEFAREQIPYYRNYHDLRSATRSISRSWPSGARRTAWSPRQKAPASCGRRCSAVPTPTTRSGSSRTPSTDCTPRRTASSYASTSRRDTRRRSAGREGALTAICISSEPARNCSP